MSARAFWTFLQVQASAALFGLLLLALILVTSAFWPPDWPLLRYDFLFFAAIAIQAGLIALKLETWEEAKVIAVFHVVGVAMEVFKTAQGSWIYPEPSVFHVGGVPLFTGFMYSAVGSYIARGWRLTGMTLEGAPPLWVSAALGLAIYVNFYSHHFLPDVRGALFLLVGVAFGRCWARFSRGIAGRAPLLALFALAATLVYIAENIGSVTGTWLYPDQHDGWRPVHPGKLGSWFLLMIVSFSLVWAIRREDATGRSTPHGAPRRP